jgi:hypothetical protein
MLYGISPPDYEQRRNAYYIFGCELTQVIYARRLALEAEKP